jgi:hypothetical protein
MVLPPTDEEFLGNPNPSVAGNAGRAAVAI